MRRPRDKAKVEGGALIVERWILARLRHAVFFSLAELNTEIAALIDELNARAFKKLPGNRQSRFINEERAHLQPLPARAYEFATWKKARVHVDYHVEIDKRYYSAPYTLIGKSVEARLTTRMVELFHHGRLVARLTASSPRMMWPAALKLMSPAHKWLMYVAPETSVWSEQSSKLTVFWQAASLTLVMASTSLPPSTSS